jgi:hypothetical protein
LCKRPLKLARRIRKFYGDIVEDGAEDSDGSGTTYGADNSDCRR